MKFNEEYVNELLSFPAELEMDAKIEMFVKTMNEHKRSFASFNAPFFTKIFFGYESDDKYLVKKVLQRLNKNGIYYGRSIVKKRGRHVKIQKVI